MISLAEPLPPAKAKMLLISILATGHVAFSGHALREMANDGITQPEAIGVLRGGVVEPGELERGSWRYPVRAGKTCVVVAFRSESATVVVTAWRMKR